MTLGRKEYRAQGLKGDTGEKGDTGPQGLKGDTGEKGILVKKGKKEILELKA